MSTPRWHRRRAPAAGSRSASRWSRPLAALTAVLLPLGVTTVTATPAAAQGPGAGFTLNLADLRFVLKQIKIAEQHAATATPEDPCGTLVGAGANQIPGTGNGRELPWGLRTVDGTCNNLIDTPDQTRFGASDTLFPRRVPARFRAAEPVPPGFPGAPGAPTSYEQSAPGNIVYDSQPRVVSNLLVDQTDTNPAAVEAAGEAPEVSENGTLSIPNVAPDTGLSAPFNSWFTLFGQFFDHGLDLVAKGGGTVFVPLQPGDPLIAGPDGVAGNGDDLPPDRRFMVLTRATNQPGGREHLNTTTSFVDQNQTYTSHPAHQVFLREYADGPAAGVQPVSSGRLIAGAGGPADEGLATWTSVKDQARTKLGIALSDTTDGVNLPELDVDAYGRFRPGPNGLPRIQLADGGFREGNLTTPVTTEGAARTGHAFLDDIAHHAKPVGDPTGRGGPDVPLAPDADTGTTDDRDPATYDDELLGLHFVAGDGRANENIGLTAVHHIFHSEHNRLVEDVKRLAATLPAAELGEWQLAPGVWKGEYLFQAARFVTEMEYQHLVFEEFARKVQPLINLFGEGGTGYNTSVDPAIKAEFAHAVYRFGHSMLDDTVARVGPAGMGSTGLIDAFLDPTAFTNGGAVSPDVAAGSIVRGMTRQVGQEIDEFVIEALRNNLLGLPLDLATINMARARETGVPTLNEARAKFFAESGNSALTPYSSWLDFGFNLKHSESLVNFVAAYGRHPSILGAQGSQAKRDAARLLVAPGDADPTTIPADAHAFLTSDIQRDDLGNPVAGGADWRNVEGRSTTGLDDIDLWIGGLAEKQVVFGGLLGPTFNYVFELQLEDLQFGDRFYYLARTAGLNLLTQLEGNSFAELIQRNTDASGLPADVFSRPDFVFNVGALGTSGPIVNDPATPDNESAMLTRMPDGTIRYGGPAHVVFNGSQGNDRMWSSEGDDTIRGEEGNDWIQGGDGVDNVIGGVGDDIIQDLAGDDVLKGGDGNDAISSGQGFGGDLNMGNLGDDFIYGGNDTTESFAGPGDDFVFAGDADDTVFGDDGNDWIEGGAGPFNLLQGDNGNPFQDDPDGGHDVLDGDGGEQDFDAEGGDDIMLMGPGVQRAEGMLGFDWTTHRGDPQPGDSDMDFTLAVPPSVEALRDRFDLVEALSGWDKNDILRGDDRAAADLGGPTDHQLTADGIARIAGLQDLLGTGVTSFAAGNIILGGAGDDVIEGRGGDDRIDGDRWLNVQLRAPNTATPDPADTRLVDSVSQLQADVFAGRIRIADITVVRTVEAGAPGAAGDSAVFAGPLAEYDIAVVDGRTRVTHARGTQADGVDTLTGVEKLDFTDQDVSIVAPAVTAQAPAPNATAVPVQADVAATFDQAVEGVDTVTFTLRPAAPAGAPTVPASVTRNGTTNQWVLNPNADLAPGTTYTATLTGGPTAIQNAAGIPLATLTWNFTTAGTANAAPTVTTRTPAENATGFAVGGNITATFNEAVQGVTGTTFTLRTTSTGAAVPAAVTYNATTRVATLNPNANLAAGTTYTATLTGGPTAIRDTAGAPLATLTWNFTTAGTANAAPTVTTRTPAENATAVPRGNNVTATFNEAVQGVTGTTFTLRNSTTGAAVLAVVTYNATTRVATLNPILNLAAGTRYTATLTGGTGAIRDTAGAPLATVTWSFTTGA